MYLNVSDRLISIRSSVIVEMVVMVFHQNADDGNDWLCHDQYMRYLVII